MAMEYHSPVHVVTDRLRFDTVGCLVYVVQTLSHNVHHPSLTVCKQLLVLAKGLHPATVHLLESLASGKRRGGRVIATGRRNSKDKGEEMS